MKKSIILVLNLIFVFTQHLLSNSTYIFFNNNYSPKVYSAGAQNWCIDISNDGCVYFANNSGLLVKEGLEWNTYVTKRRQTLRCVQVLDDRIYVGGGEDLGYFTKNRGGGYVYIDLTDKIAKNIKWGEVWNIIRINNKIYFQGGQAIIVFDLKNDSFIKYIETKNTSYIYNHDGVILIQNAKGFQKYDQDLNIVSKIQNSELLNNTIITGIFRCNSDLIISTLSNGIFILKNDKVIMLSSLLNNELIANQIYKSIKVSDNLFAFGTVLDGVYFTDSDFNLIQHIGTNEGIINNTVLSMCKDNNGNLWLGHDWGCSYIETSFPLLYGCYNKKIGTAYAYLHSKNYRYYGTNQGLFYSDKDSIIELVEKMQGQVYFLEKVRDKILCGHHNGLFILDNHNRVNQLSNEKGFVGYNKISDDYFVLKTYNNVYLYHYEDGNFYRSFKINHDEAKIWTNIKEDSKNNKWWSFKDSMALLTHIDFDNNKLLIEKQYILDSKIRNIHNYGLNLIFETDSDLYKYNKDSDNFLRIDSIPFDIKYSKDIIRIYLDTNLTFEKITRIFLGSKFILMPIYRIKNELKNHNVVNYCDNDNTQFMLNGYGSFILYPIKNQSLISRKQIHTYINRIEYKKENRYLPLDSLELPYELNNIRFKFFSSENDNSSDIYYKYKLIGFDNEFSSYSKETLKEYTNLNEGGYTFQVVSTDGIAESKPVEISFYIHPPIYRSLWAKCLYIFLFLIFIRVAYLFVLRIIKAKEVKIQKQKEEELERIKSNHRIERLNHEKTIIMMEKDKLKTEVQHKQQELANSTHSIVLKNQLLISIKEDLECIYNERNIEMRDNALNRIFNKINSNINNENDWAVFENYFNELHSSFFKSLKDMYPDLSTTELKLCAYLRLNKTTKEIAALMNISVRGVETARYRLRKKLQIGREDNIYDLLIKM